MTKLLCIALNMFVLVNISNVLVTAKRIPTTLEGPFEPVTRRFDPSLRRGSDDVPIGDPRVRRNVTGMLPEQIAIALSTKTYVWVSWVTGAAQIGLNITPLDPSTVSSEVWYGKESGKYSMKKTGSSMVYSQLYPFEGLQNYTSGIIHHVRIDGLEPECKYFYKCGDSALQAISEEQAFETLPFPGPNSYPHRIAVVGDLGLTSNSTTTIDHLIKNDPSMILMVGDLTYANQYLTTGGKGASCFSCAFPDAPIRETYQPRWDEWGRFMQRITSKVPMMVIEGNHEIEPQADGITFKSYLTRFSVPSEECNSNTNFYYSFDAGGVHFIMLGEYVDFNTTGEQYAWLKKDLCNLDRSVTPWLVAAWHSPWYNSYSSHYQEFECMRQQMETLLYQYRVDIVFSGHVHAYERMNRVYNYMLDPCGPVYITVGDGGNIEKVDVDHADEPGKCPSPGDNIPEFGNVCHLNFSSGSAKGKFCWDRQPEWSAYRESSFGHGILEDMDCMDIDQVYEVPDTPDRVASNDRKNRGRVEIEIDFSASAHSRNTHVFGEGHQNQARDKSKLVIDGGLNKRLFFDPIRGPSASKKSDGDESLKSSLTKSPTSKNAHLFRKIMMDRKVNPGNRLPSNYQRKGKGISPHTFQSSQSRENAVVYLTKQNGPAQIFEMANPKVIQYLPLIPTKERRK